MQLRNRLLTAFTIMAFVIVSLFAVMSYQISIDSKKRTEAEFLLHYLGEFEEIIAPSLQQEMADISKIQGLKHILDFVDEGEYLLLEHNGQIYDLGHNQNYQTKNNSHPYNPDFIIEKIINNKSNSGQTIINNINYAWAAKLIGDTGYRAILYRATQDDGTFAENSSIWKRLLITAGIIFWLTVWAALILSSWMAKKLDKQNQQLIYQATHDALTNLPNRSYLFQQLNRLIQTEKKSDTRIVLYFMDLDGFKELNDTLGHTYGDSLLKLIASRLSPERIECDLIARMGGDEFALLKVHGKDDNIHEFIQLIMSKLADPISFEGIEYQIRGSIGVAMYPFHGTNPESIIQHAEVAMYKAKDKTTNYVIYSKEDNPNSIRRLKLISELHTAVKNKELLVYYQPKIDLQKKRISGVEALVRWNHPQLGFISPVEFIPLAEQVGLITHITDQVLLKTIQNWNKWHQMGIELHVAVNISSKEFEDPSLPAKVLNYLKDWHMPSSFLTLEITESIMMGNIDHTLTLLQHLRDIHIKLSIDDFGTGFSSLSYLRQLPVSELKIDRSFVMEMLKHSNDLKIVKTIINLAHILDFNVVAEGIEDLKTFNTLTELGCDSAQGFYMAKPMPAEELEKWCAESEWGTEYDVDFSPHKKQKTVIDITTAESLQNIIAQQKLKSS
ncbi:MAG: EAL domain-containing protein [Gammaproteobacteria bacterium]|nr:EAL domain-containing protein [Gammaproteobacteria bacterium]